MDGKPIKDPLQEASFHFLSGEFWTDTQPTLAFLIEGDGGKCAVNAKPCYPFYEPTFKHTNSCGTSNAIQGYNGPLAYSVEQATPNNQYSLNTQLSRYEGGGEDTHSREPGYEFHGSPFGESMICGPASTWSNPRSQQYSDAIQRSQDGRHSRDGTSEPRTGDGMRNKQKHLNRIAARKCRLKQHRGNSKLEKDVDQMKVLNDELTKQVANLKFEIYKIKLQLLQHTDCDCKMIKRYIAHQARKNASSFL